MKVRRYVLVADAARARLFREPMHGHGFELVDDWEHAESRKRNRDIVSDANGRKPAGPSVGQNYGGRSVSLGVGRPGVAPDTEPKEVEAQKFARSLATMVAAALEKDHEAALVLAAPPHFLGLLRESLGDAVARRIERTIDKELTNVGDLRELRERIHAELGPR